MNFIKITKDDSLSQYIKGFENMSNQVEIDDQYNDVLRLIKRWEQDGC